jgi:hypothetical protein
MFSIEMRFKEGGRDVALERFTSLLFGECLSEPLNDLVTRLQPASAPAHPPTAAGPITSPRAERRVVSVAEAAQLLGLSPSTIRA